MADLGGRPKHIYVTFDDGTIEIVHDSNCITIISDKAYKSMKATPTPPPTHKNNAEACPYMPHVTSVQEGDGLIMDVDVREKVKAGMISREEILRTLKEQRSEYDARRKTNRLQSRDGGEG